VLVELVPQAKAIALLVNPNNPGAAESLIRDMPTIAHSRGLDVPILRAATEDELETDFGTTAQMPADALLVRAIISSSSRGNGSPLSRSGTLFQRPTQASSTCGPAGS